MSFSNYAVQVPDPFAVWVAWPPHQPIFNRAFTHCTCLIGYLPTARSVAELQRRGFRYPVGAIICEHMGGVIE